jgi:hypothetical protein
LGQEFEFRVQGEGFAFAGLCSSWFFDDDAACARVGRASSVRLVEGLGVQAQHSGQPRRPTHTEGKGVRGVQEAARLAEYGVTQTEMDEAMTVLTNHYVQQAAQKDAMASSGWMKRIMAAIQAGDQVLSPVHKSQVGHRVPPSVRGACFCVACRPPPERVSRASLPPSISVPSPAPLFLALHPWLSAGPLSPALHLCPLRRPSGLILVLRSCVASLRLCADLAGLFCCVRSTQRSICV